MNQFTMNSASTGVWRYGVAVALLVCMAGQAHGGEWMGFLLHKNMWGAERPCLDCCVCPDNYCPKCPPTVPFLCPTLCPDYCAKPEPCVPRLCPSLCPDYCPKPMPCVLGFLCRPGLSCGPACNCDNRSGCNPCNVRNRVEGGQPAPAVATPQSATKKLR